MAAAVTVMLAAACSSSPSTTAQRDPSPSRSTTSEPDPSTSTSTIIGTSTSTSTCTITGDSNKKESATGTAATLVAVRIGLQACSDRIVFEMQQAGPAALQYTVETARPPFTEDASGKPVSVKGNAFVRVVMRDTSGYDFTAGKVAYTGGNTVRPPGTPRRIVEAKATGDFERVVSWVIGLNATYPFRVQVLGSPLRLVIDFEGG